MRHTSRSLRDQVAVTEQISARLEEAQTVMEEQSQRIEELEVARRAGLGNDDDGQGSSGRGQDGVESLRSQLKEVRMISLFLIEGQRKHVGRLVAFSTESVEIAGHDWTAAA